jgi:replicative DNA helicase
VELLDPKFFQDKNNKTLVGLLSDFHQKRGKAPSLTELKVKIVEEHEQEAYKHIVSKLKSFDRNFDDNELYANTEKFFRDKSIFFTILKASEKIGNLDDSLDEIVNELQSAVGINLTHSLGFDLRRDIDKLVDELKTVYKTMSSGWKWLDDHLGGGFQEIGRALYVFCGITNIGKSIFLGSVAQAIAKQNKNVLLISLEMPEHMYVKRLCSQITKIPLNEMQKYADVVPERLMDSLRHTEGNILVKEFPPSTITVGQLEAYIKKVTQITRIDAIVVDYVNILKGTFGNNSYEKVKDMTEKLRALSYTFNCPIITATQLNRAAAERDRKSVV